MGGLTCNTVVFSRETCPSYTVESIKPLKALVAQDIAWGELLFRGKYPQTVDGWRAWYRRIPEIIPDLQIEYSRISVNVDSFQVLDSSIEKSLYGLSGLPVALEWTETHHAGVGQPEIMEVGRRLDVYRKQSGIPIVLDDVGAGQDALSRLCALEPDYIKIDGHVFQMARTSRRIRDLLAFKVAFYEEHLGIPVVIEWIENPEDLSLAQNLGASWGQGFLWQH